MLVESREKEGVCFVMQMMVRIRKKQEIIKRQKVSSDDRNGNHNL
jgi:hypothetical protein